MMKKRKNTLRIEKTRSASRPDVTAKRQFSFLNMVEASFELGNYIPRCLDIAAINI